MTVTQKLYSERHLIPGWGCDRRPEDRPGVPRERRPPRPDSGAHWGDPVPMQRSHYRPLWSNEYVERPPVFGTSCRLRGLSGWIRRRAFRRNEGDRRHWLMLLLADRIDVLEGSLLDLLRGRMGSPLREAEPSPDVRQSEFRGRLNRGRDDRRRLGIPAILAAAAIGGAYLVFHRSRRRERAA